MKGVVITMGYKKYAKDYKPQIVSANDGRSVKEIYVYKGPYFAVRFPSEGEKKKAKLLSALGAAICCILFLAAGFIDAPAARKLYVAIPYIIEMAPAAFLALGAGLCLRAPEEMKREEADRSWRRVNTMSMLLAAAAGIAFLTSLLYMFFAGNISLSGIIFTLLNGLIAAISGYTAFFMHKKCKIEEVETAKSGKNL